MSVPLRRFALTLVLGAAMAAPSGLRAQGGLPLPEPSRSSGDSGFLFERPRVSLGLRMGAFFHRAGSDLYDFAEERFTVDRSDFRGAAIGVEAAAWIGERTEIVLGIDGNRVSLGSEYRHLVEDNGDPIRQTTRITHGPAFSLGARQYLFPKGEELGRFVWIPRRLNAFVGAGAALSGYDLLLEGDFVDEQELTISTEEFQSDGNTLLPFLSGGVELSLTTRATLMLEGGYQWGDAELGDDFRDNQGRPTFEPLDLSGGRVTLGFYYRL